MKIIMKLFFTMYMVMNLSACDSSNSKTTSTSYGLPEANATTAKSAMALMSDNTATKKTDKAILIVATNSNMPPFSYLNDKGDLIGMDIELIRKIAELQGFEVKFEKMPWQNVLTAVKQGKADMAIGGISYNADQLQHYGFTKSYLYVPSAIVYKADNPKMVGKKIDKIEDLKGLNIVGMKEAKQIKQIEKLGIAQSVNYTETPFLSFKKVLNDEVDVVFEDQQVLEYYAKNYPNYKLRVIPYDTLANLESQQIMVTSKDNTQLLNKLNQSIDKLYEDGTINKLENKWVNNTNQ